ncbi:MAG: hypothetical protein AAGA75_00485 [Cyanobacteria bacterium P01_E01_bin.6]
MNYFLRAVVITVLIVPYWWWLYPLLFDVATLLPADNGLIYGLYPLGFLASPFFRAILFFFLTRWKLHFLSEGWSAEVRVLRLEGVTVLASLLRWIVLAVVLVFIPPAISILMLHLLTQYTMVPQWLSNLTSWIVLFKFLQMMWVFPYSHIARIRSL